MKINQTPKNPYALTIKQQLVIEIMTTNVLNGNRMNAKKAHLDIYNTKKPGNASIIASKNLKKLNFHQALFDKLESMNIIGGNSKIEKIISEGLDAVDYRGNPDFRVRLEYIKEINRIIGLVIKD